MINDKKLKYLMSEDGMDYYSYVPKFGKWMYKNYDHMRFQRWVRYLLEYISEGRYVVYYMAKGDCILGYCFSAAGGRRLKCSNKNDIVLGPYYVLPEHRGNGYSKMLIRTVAEKLHTNYEFAYDYISRDNISSLRATEACGFDKYKELNIVGFFRKLNIVNNGEYIVYRKHL